MREPRAVADAEHSATKSSYRIHELCESTRDALGFLHKLDTRGEVPSGAVAPRAPSKLR